MNGESLTEKEMIMIARIAKDLRARTGYKVTHVYKEDDAASWRVVYRVEYQVHGVGYTTSVTVDASEFNTYDEGKLVSILSSAFSDAMKWKKLLEGGSQNG